MWTFLSFSVENALSDKSDLLIFFFWGGVNHVCHNLTSPRGVAVGAAVKNMATVSSLATIQSKKQVQESQFDLETLVSVL